LNWFVPIWSGLIQIYPIWSNLVQSISFNSLWYDLNQFEPIWSKLIWFDPIWTDLNQFDRSWSNLNQFGPTWTNFIWFEPNNQPGPSWSFLIQFEPIWSSLIHFGRIWSNLIQNKTAIFILMVNVTTFYSIILWSNRHWGKWLQTWQRTRSLSKQALLKLKNCFFLILSCIHYYIDNFQELNLGKVLFLLPPKLYRPCFVESNKFF
jgi:hypothetical protein